MTRISSPITAILIAASLLPAIALAQQSPGYDCNKASGHRDFDFWLGNWTVASEPGDTHYGNNRINSAEKGCLLLEHWTSANGGTGSSVNYYHPGENKWHQQWNDAGASIITISGGLQGKAMVMEGDIYYLAEKRSAAFRGSWTPLADGRVRQFFEEKDNEGQWNTWFDGYYTREPEGAVDIGNKR
jgi:hypothetical protein